MFHVDADDGSQVSVGHPATFVNWQTPSALTHCVSGRWDIAIVDSYRADEPTIGTIANNSEKTAFFDDDNRLPYPKGFLINGSPGAHGVGYPKSAAVCNLLGAQYQVLRKEFWGATPVEVAPRVVNTLITFGGSGLDERVAQYVDVISHRFPDIHHHVVSPDSRVTTGSNVSVYGRLSAAEMIGLMNRCDLAVSGGGQTLAELAVLGIPVVCVGVAENQRHNIEGWRIGNTLDFAGWLDEADTLERTTALIEGNMGYAVRKEKSLNGQSLIDGRGARRIVQALLGETNGQLP